MEKENEKEVPAENVKSKRKCIFDVCLLSLYNASNSSRGEIEIKRMRAKYTYVS